MCPSCKHELKILDLIPVFSWLYLRGKCRYCHKPISGHYPLIELITTLILILSFSFWPQPLTGMEIVSFGFWVMFVVGLVALALYDVKWYILPDKITYPLIALAVLQLAVNVIFYHAGHMDIANAFWGVVISAGLFFLLFQISEGKWIGGGDVKLGVLIGILVGGPLMSSVVLFLASLIGTLYTVPFLIRGKTKFNSKIPFGPFLIIACIIVKLFGISLVGWYKHLYM